LKYHSGYSFIALWVGFRLKAETGLWTAKALAYKAKGRTPLGQRPSCYQFVIFPKKSIFLMIFRLTSSFQAVHGAAAGGKVNQFFFINQFGGSLFDHSSLDIRKYLLNRFLDVVKVKFGLFARFSKVQNGFFHVFHYCSFIASSVQGKKRFEAAPFPRTKLIEHSFI